MIVEMPVEVARKAAELAAAFVHPGRRAYVGARRKSRAVALSALGVAA